MHQIPHALRIKDKQAARVHGQHTYKYTVISKIQQYIAYGDIKQNKPYFYWYLSDKTFKDAFWITHSRFNTAPLQDIVICTTNRYLPPTIGKVWTENLLMVEYLLLDREFLCVVHTILKMCFKFLSLDYFCVKTKIIYFNTITIQ